MVWYRGNTSIDKFGHRERSLSQNSAVMEWMRRSQITDKRPLLPRLVLRVDRGRLMALLQRLSSPSSTWGHH